MLKPVLAGLVTLIGIALTSVGVFTHPASSGSPLVAPGAVLAFVGGAWLGVSLARRNVRLLPGTQIADEAGG
jgi:hypothetical protein